MFKKTLTLFEIERCQKLNVGTFDFFVFRFHESSCIYLKIAETSLKRFSDFFSCVNVDIFLNKSRRYRDTVTSI